MTREQLLALADVAEVDPQFLEDCVRCGAVGLEDHPEEGLGLSASESARLRRLQRLCRGLEIDVFSGCIIVDLLDRMDGLQRALAGAPRAAKGRTR